MPVKLTSTNERLTEGSTGVFTVSFTDAAGSAVTPNDGTTWTLTDISGNVINSREDEAIVEASSVDIVLSGDDLGITATEKAAATKEYVLRVLTIEGTYDSDEGSDLPIREQAQFRVYITTVDHDVV